MFVTARLSVISQFVVWYATSEQKLCILYQFHI